MEDVFDRALAEVGREPLCMTVASQIRASILSGALSDGTALPSEKELSARLGVGRSTVREALRILQAQGLISGGSSVSTKGPVVTRDGALPIAASALEAVVALGQVPLADLVGLRTLIESAALRAAAEARREDALEAAEAALEEMRAAGADVERAHRADVAFHAALIDGADNGAYSLVYRVLRESIAAHLRDALDAEPDPGGTVARLVAEHEDILEAVRAGDGHAAAATLRGHLDGFYGS
ncbi:MAG: FCD domain-containing protein [Myxococcota bacterium]|nr:FCD domain-containing protein [Myxococcota bacterium]